MHDQLADARVSRVISLPGRHACSGIGRQIGVDQLAFARRVRVGGKAASMRLHQHCRCGPWPSRPAGACAAPPGACLPPRCGAEGSGELSDSPRSPRAFGHCASQRAH
jgi:hypothetical protein